MSSTPISTVSPVNASIASSSLGTATSGGTSSTLFASLLQHLSTGARPQAEFSSQAARQGQQGETQEAPIGTISFEPQKPQSQTVEPRLEEPGMTVIDIAHAHSQAPVAEVLDMAGLEPALAFTESSPAAISQESAALTFTNAVNAEAASPQAFPSALQALQPVSAKPASAAPLASGERGVVRADVPGSGGDGVVVSPMVVAAPVSGVGVQQVQPVVVPAPLVPVMDVSRVEVARQLRGPIVQLAAAESGEQTITVRLTPESLGTVEVRATVTPKGLHVQLVAATDQTRDMLRAMSLDLRRELGVLAPAASLVVAERGLGSSLSQGQQEFVSRSHGREQSSTSRDGQPGDRDGRSDGRRRATHDGSDFDAFV